MNIDFKAMSLESKSHTAHELQKAIEAGKVILSLDSGTGGRDDLLIYEPATPEQEIMDELLSFFELGAYAAHECDRADPFDRTRPNYWTLEKLDLDEIERRWPVE